MTTTNELLSRVSGIRMKHELVAELTGENFNVFSILGMQTAENRTHSAFLRELLDPKGTHGMGDAFLRAFIRMLRDKFEENCGKANLDESSIGAQPIAAKAATEVHLGYKSDDLTQGGRVDLKVAADSSRWTILIENKIHAGDQECQLVRYRNSDASALLLYLTLNGDKASASSVTDPITKKQLDAGSDYIPISYRKQILDWLEECAKEASTRPLVRETIVQYAHLVRILTDQNSSNLMTQQITDTVLSSKEAFLAYKAIQNADQKVKEVIISNLRSRLFELADELGLEFDIDIDVYPAKESGFWFWEKEWEDSGMKIAFYCNERWLNDWGYGIGGPGDSVKPSPLSSHLIDELSLRFSKQFFSKHDPNKCWVSWAWWKDYLNWSDADTLASVYFGNFINDVKGILLATLPIMRDAGLPGGYKMLETNHPA